MINRNAPACKDAACWLRGKCCLSHSKKVLRTVKIPPGDLVPRTVQKTSKWGELKTLNIQLCEYVWSNLSCDLSGVGYLGILSIEV